MSSSHTFDPKFLSQNFWHGDDIHIALPPHHPPPPSHLIETARTHLPEGGCLFLTSGTTGTPKWVALEKRAFLHSARVVNAHYDLTQTDLWLLSLPLHHVGGFSILARAYLSHSRVYCSPAKWSVEAFALSLHESNASVTSLVPTQLHDLVLAETRSPSSLRVVFLGGGRIQPSLMKRALDLGWPVCATYGMTETASQVASQPLDHDRINDPETIEILPHWHAQTDSNNTLTLQGPSLAKGYLIVTDEQTRWQPIDPAVGLTTRDQVKLWFNGTRSYLKFLTRNENVVKIVGELVSLETLEQRLMALLPPDFPPLAIAALPDERREHRLVLAVETSLAHSPDVLVTALSRLNAASPPCERIDSTLTLPHFPRTDLGKVSRSELTRTLSDHPLPISNLKLT